MIGYKLLDRDMKAIHGNGMQYKLGKKYSMNKKNVKVCSLGYHFYKELIDCINSTIYDVSNSRLFKVEVGEYIEDYKDDDDYSTKSVSNEITLLEEISREDIIEYCKENRSKINKLSLARLGLFLDELYKDEDPYIRREVAKQGRYLDILVKDKDWIIRLEVAKQGKYLDILVNDVNPDIRFEIARQGKYLDILVKDANPNIRWEVARQGRDKYLGILVKDENWFIRREIAHQGKYLDILVKDKDWRVRVEIAKQGKYLDILVNDEDWMVRSEARIR